ncbi:MAG: hypothetical protein QM796_08120 [Chthoniobacteraceae bacterium]
MTSPRHTMIGLVIGAGLLSSAFAQDSGDSTGGGSASTSGDSSSSSTSQGSGSSSSSSGSNLFTPAPTSGGTTTSGETNPFVPASVSGNTSTDNSGTTGASPGLNTSSSASQPSAPPVTINGAFGSAPVTLQAGAGQFAKKPFKFNLSVTQGYDDNVFSAPDQRQTEEIIQGTPSQTFTYEQTIPAVAAVPPKILPGGLIIPGTPAIPAHTVKRKITIPGTPDQVVELPESITSERIGSAVSTASLGFSMNFASPRSLFSLQLHGANEYYWDRPEKKQDYNGGVTLVFSHAITPRMRINATVDAVYQNNPDFSRLNAGTRSVQGDYYDSNTKIDLTYQWNTRFSTDTAYSLNGTYYANAGEQNGNLTQNVFSNDFRLQISPRTTLVTSYRYAVDSRKDASLDDTTQFVLGGFDLSVNSRLSTTFRAGSQEETFKGGRSTTSPYVEMTMNYVYGKGSTIIWTNHYGMEVPDLNTKSVDSYVTSLSINHVLTARTSLGVGINWTHRATDYLLSTTPSLQEDYIGGSLTLQYIYSEAWSMNLSYNYNQLVSSSAFTSYHRNQVFLGLTYSF